MPVIKPSAARQQLLKTFTVDFNSDQDQRRYQGQFTTKKLSIRDLAALGVRKTQLNGGLHHDTEHAGAGVDSSTDELNNMLAHLEICLVEVPTFWKLDEITDFGLLGIVYKEVLLHENTFLSRTGFASNQGHVGSSEASSSSTAQKSDDAGVSGPVVVPQVSSSLEP